MTKLRNLHVLLAIGFLAGCSDITGSQSRPSAAVSAPSPIASAMVRQVQDRLQHDGYYRQGPLDGVWGSGTMDAVAQFQRDHSLHSSGQLDLPTLEALNITAPEHPQTAAR